jgi:hypothetical protein
VLLHLPALCSLLLPNFAKPPAEAAAATTTTKEGNNKALPTLLPTLVLASSAQNIGRFKLPNPNLGLMRPRVTRRRQHKTTKKNENTKQTTTTTTIMSKDR